MSPPLGRVVLIMACARVCAARTVVYRGLAISPYSRGRIIRVPAATRSPYRPIGISHSFSVFRTSRCSALDRSLLRRARCCLLVSRRLRTFLTALALDISHRRYVVAAHNQAAMADAPSSTPVTMASSAPSSTASPSTAAAAHATSQPSTPAAPTTFSSRCPPSSPPRS